MSDRSSQIAIEDALRQEEAFDLAVTNFGREQQGIPEKIQLCIGWSGKRRPSFLILCSTHMLNPSELYTVEDAARFLKVNICSVYQSIPRRDKKPFHPKLGRVMPAPVRLGRMIRFSGQQLLDFVSPPPAQEPDPSAAPESVRRGRGRPRKTCAGVTA